MLDNVKAGDTVDLSLLLAFGRSSLGHIVLISELGLRCGCVKAAGVQRLSTAELCPKHPM